MSRRDDFTGGAIILIGDGNSTANKSGVGIPQEQFALRSQRARQTQIIIIEEADKLGSI